MVSLFDTGSLRSLVWNGKSALVYGSTVTLVLAETDGVEFDCNIAPAWLPFLVVIPKFRGSLSRENAVAGLPANQQAGSNKFCHGE
jgi:hypothetical protein